MDTTDAPQLVEHINQSVTFTTYDTKWVPCSARFVACGITPNAKGILKVHELDGGKLKVVDERTKDAGIKCATFGASSLAERHIACGDYSGKLSIYDLERNDLPRYSVQAHSSIINAIDGVGGSQIHCGAPEIVTGGRDGAVRVWDPRVNEPVLALETQVGGTPRDCWAVGFGNSYNDDERCICAGYDNGDVKMFDLRTTGTLWETNVDNGITSVQFDRQDIEMNKLVVTTLESRFRIFDLRTKHPHHGFSSLTEKAHKSTVWLAKHLPQNREVFMTGGGNGGFNLYRYEYPSKRYKLHPDDGHRIGVLGKVNLLNSRVISTQPIISFDWSPDKEGLCVLSCLDQTLRVYIVTRLGSL